MAPYFFYPFLSSVLILLLHAALISAGPVELQKAYIVYLGQRPRNDIDVNSLHSSVLQEVIGDDAASERILHSYSKSFNGFAAMLTEEEAQLLSRLDEVVSAFPSTQRQLSTTRSWDFMGFTTNAPRAAFESDIIIGMLDTGIWPESKSFDDSGFGPPPTRWKGICESNNNFTCNNKIIGARYYHLQGNISAGDIPSPRDNNGHGSHTSSTAAGRQVPNASLAGLADGLARGGVPSARIAVYKVCWNNEGCSDVDLLAAFDDAISDGVEIISLSVGSIFSRPYFSDAIAIGAFHAVRNGVLVSCSAGNSGPERLTVANFAPWILTVAASTIDRKFIVETNLGNGEVYQGKAINTFGRAGELIYGGNAPNASSGADSSAARFCQAGSLDDKLVKGKVVVCDGLSDGSGSRLAGAVAVIMPAAGANDYALEFGLPASILSPDDNTRIVQYANKTTYPTANVSKSQGVFDSAAPYVVSFSSRGPNPITSNLLKPDITAPGVDILAAWSPLSTEEPGVSYNIISGTSMACPHATGTAAYVKSFNPTWSPSAIKSAIMTTAFVMNSTKNREAEFAYGAGHINPIAAVKPGLVYDADATDYIKFLCSQGYTTKNLRLITGDNSSCTAANHGTVFDLNYPSFALSVVNITKPIAQTTFHRTVTNVGAAHSTYRASVSAPAGLKITVEPEELSFEAHLEKKTFALKIEGDAGAAFSSSKSAMLSAALVWSDGTHRVRSPVVVYKN
ncbi:Cucumisin [Apostasia shenzhenica]|uniref:Cucumisin n=1 Tax=Apostasia shenzhenica TaxID=1088818 RepID=A0A2I0B5R4_9ASPA|nr:Cucumisin [Apostasia shenzhenica]